MIRLFLSCLLLSAALGHADTATRDVGIGVHLDDITHIKPSQEIVVMEITKHLRWQTKERHNKARYYYGDQVDLMLPKIDAPYYQIRHLRGSTDAKYKSLVIESNGMAHFQESMGLEVETKLQMHNFPFDKQSIKLLISPYGDSPFTDRLYILPDNVGIDKKAHLAEWHISGAHNEIINRQEKPLYQMTVHYERLPEFYIYKIFIPMLLILGISYMVLWMPKQAAINRLGVVITAMLTIVAFQWAISAQIPSVSYITFLQALLLFFYIMIGSKALLIVIGEVLSQSHSEQLMRAARWIYPLVLVLGLIVISLIWL